MTDSLTRLVLRAQGLLPTAEPLLPSRYASAAIPATDWEASEPLQTLALQPHPAPVLQTALRTPEPEHPTIQEFRPLPRSTPTRDDSPAGKPRTQSEPMQPQIDSGRPERLAAMLVEAPAQPPGSPALIEQPASSATALPEAALASPTDPLAPAAQPVRAGRSPAPPVAGSTIEATETQPPWPLALDAVPPPPPPSSAIAPEPLEAVGARQFRLTAQAAASPPDFPGRQTQVAVPDVQISIGVVELHALPRRPAANRPTPARRPQLSLAEYLAQRNGKTS